MGNIKTKILENFYQDIITQKKLQSIKKNIRLLYGIVILQRDLLILNLICVKEQNLS